MRKIVYSALPTGKGIILDSFSGGGSTLAAAIHFGYECIGLEKDTTFFAMSQNAIPKLAALYPNLFTQTENVSVSARRKRVSRDYSSAEALF